jgi:hypothetical protein
MNDTGFRPTHVTPLDGMPTWAGPDPAEPSAWLDAVLPVRVVDTRGDWARVQCSNGWAAWADGRLLIALPEAPAGAAQPLARTPDPRPLLARLERALSAYRQLVEQLAQGRLDLQTFRERSVGLRLGVIVDGESAWLLDLEHDRWWYCHDTQLQTFATVEAPPDQPGERPAPGPEERLSKPGAPSGEAAAAEDQPPASDVTGRVQAGER